MRADVLDRAAGRRTAVALARCSLADARVDLDHAVAALSASTDEKVMATSIVVDLLFRVVAARRRLEELERGPNAGPPAP